MPPVSTHNLERQNSAAESARKGPFQSGGDTSRGIRGGRVVFNSMLLLQRRGGCDITVMIWAFDRVCVCVCVCVCVQREAAVRAAGVEAQHKVVEWRGVVML